MTAAREPKLFLLTHAGEIVEEESWRGNHGSIRKHLEASAAIWSHLDAFEPSVNIWRQLEVLGTIWSLDNVCMHLDTSGSI